MILCLNLLKMMQLSLFAHLTIVDPLGSAFNAEFNTLNLVLLQKQTFVTENLT